MIWFNKLSIYKKILFMTLALILLLGGILSCLVWNFMDDMIAQQLKKRGMEIASHVAQRSANYVLVDNYYSLHELIRQTQDNSEDIRYIMVFDKDDRLLAHTFSNGIPKGLKVLPPRPQYGTVTLSSNVGLIYDTIIPIENGEIGFVRVGMTEEHTRNLVREKINHLLLVTLLVCVLAALICLRITLFVTRPISDLAEVAAKITEGNLKVRAAVGACDEVGSLALVFNGMTDKLIAGNQEKERLLLELEEKEKMRNILIEKLITAQEDERKRISRELHDETSQALASLMVTMRVLAEDSKDDAQKSALLMSRDVTADILREIRNLAVELRPPVLDDLGLVPALEKYISEFSARFGIQVETELASITLAGQSAVALYRIVQEALTNVFKHSGAKKAKVRINEAETQIILSIKDDGRGISSSDLEKAKKEKRLGLYGMSERAEILGGSFHIAALPEQGTCLEVIIPK